MKSLLVWDLPTRLFHALLVAGVTACALTAFVLPPAGFSIHFIAGYGIAALLLFRLVWAACGPQTSRFAGFLPRPTHVLSHLWAMAIGQPARYIGHNPAGGAMVLALLLVLGGLVGSGLITLGGVEKQGPLASLTTYTLGASAKEIHETLAFLLLGLVAVHIVGALVEGRLTGEALVRAMWWHGRKEVPANIPTVAPARLRLAVPLLAAMALLVGGGVLLLRARPVEGWRPLAFPSLYVKECGSCHMPFHPSLLVAADWQRVMDRLDDHFGENASLPADTVVALTEWLRGNAAETWDTRPAHLAHGDAADDSGRITAQLWWRHQHRHLADTIFAQKAVTSRANCAACHHDAAEGWFRPQNIHVPTP